MGILAKIFTWWDGATIGTALDSWRHGRQVGVDLAGNRYFETKKANEGQMPRRWVIYAGANDSSLIAPEWHGWIHGSESGPPESNMPPPHIWEKPATGNLTGTARAYRPQGALESGGNRAAATGDYEAWSPEG